MGLLNHACKVVHSGRSFLRRMIDLLHTRTSRTTQPTAVTPIRLNHEFRADLAWWQIFIEDWNGTSFLPTPQHLPECHIASDASGSWGCGAWHGRKWFQLQWSEATFGLPIAVKELLPILIGAAIWGAQWSNHRVVWHCDNQAVVAALRSRTSRHPVLMHLLRNFVFIEARFRFHLCPVYINTYANHLADDLSRNKMLSFFLKVPHASTTPELVPTALVDLLLDRQAEWTSRLWRHQFNLILGRASPSPLRSRTEQQ